MRRFRLLTLVFTVCVSMVRMASAQEATTSSDTVSLADQTSGSEIGTNGSTATQALHFNNRDREATSTSKSSPAKNSYSTTVTAEPPATEHHVTTASLATTPVDNPTSISTPEGVIYQVLKAGNGPVESITHTLLLHYTLYLTNGKRLESSRDAEFPVPLKLKRNTDSFIKGFEIGTEGMRIGEVRRIYIPAALGYGEKGNEVIPPNSPLIFETELVDLK